MELVWEEESSAVFSNFFLVVIGYHAFASGVKKRTLEAFRQIGCGYLRQYGMSIKGQSRCNGGILKGKAQIDSLYSWATRRLTSLMCGLAPDRPNQTVRVYAAYLDQVAVQLCRALQSWKGFKNFGPV